MAAQKTEIRYFFFKIGLNSTLDLLAGDSATLASGGQYKIHNGMDAKTYGSVMSAVRDALLAGEGTATLLVEGGWIVGAPVTTWQNSMVAALSEQAANVPVGRSSKKTSRKKKDGPKSIK